MYFNTQGHFGIDLDKQKITLDIVTLRAVAIGEKQFSAFFSTAKVVLSIRLYCYKSVILKKVCRLKRHISTFPAEVEKGIKLTVLSSH